MGRYQGLGFGLEFECGRLFRIRELEELRYRMRLLPMMRGHSNSNKTDLANDNMQARIWQYVVM